MMPILSGITARETLTWARPLARQASSTGTRRLLCAIVLAAFGALLWPASPASAAQLRLVKTIRTSAFAPPSPDPSGITYRPGRDRLIISDSEVDETGLYRGRNLFTARRAGTGFGSGTLLPFANKEPSGIGLNPRTATLFATNDDKDRISRVVPGPDGAHGTGDDTVRNLSTSAFGSFDPEGIEYDPGTRSLFVCDGRGLEVYRVSPVNGRLISHFDLARYGARDCEGLGLDPRGTNSLLAIDWRTDTIYELGTGGVLIRRLRLSAIPTANSVVAGVTMAPTSNRNDRRSRLSYWIVDRHIDNNSRTPPPIDGLLYEMVVRTR